MKCYLIFCTLHDCGCPTCDVFTKCETIRFVDSPGDTYGLIPLDQYNQTAEFNICWDHRMLMNLISWGDRQFARARDLDLDVSGHKQNTKWLDTVVVCGKVCKISIEIFCPIQSAPVFYHQCYARPQQYYQQWQQPHVYYVDQPPHQHQRSHSRSVSSIGGGDSIIGEVVQQMLVGSLFELTRDIGMSFFGF
jgi:hypothetical protein